jgi:hypothetical protein
MHQHQLIHHSRQHVLQQDTEVLQFAEVEEVKTLSPCTTTHHASTRRSGTRLASSCAQSHTNASSSGTQGCSRGASCPCDEITLQLSNTTVY